MLENIIIVMGVVAGIVFIGLAVNAARAHFGNARRREALRRGEARGIAHRPFSDF